MPWMYGKDVIVGQFPNDMEIIRLGHCFDAPVNNLLSQKYAPKILRLRRVFPENVERDFFRSRA